MPFPGEHRRPGRPLRHTARMHAVTGRRVTEIDVG
jgi:hypothetical protein